MEESRETVYLASVTQSAFNLRRDEIDTSENSFVYLSKSTSYRSF